MIVPPSNTLPAPTPAPRKAILRCVSQQAHRTFTYRTRFIIPSNNGKCSSTSKIRKWLPSHGSKINCESIKRNTIFNSIRKQTSVKDICRAKDKRQPFEQLEQKLCEGKHTYPKIQRYHRHSEQYEKRGHCKQNIEDRQSESIDRQAATRQLSTQKKFKSIVQIDMMTMKPSTQSHKSIEFDPAKWKKGVIQLSSKKLQQQMIRKISANMSNLRCPSIKNSINSFNYCSSSNEQLAALKLSKKEILTLKHRLRELNQVRMKVETSKQNNKLLKNIQSYCSNKITGFFQEYEKDIKNMQAQTSQFKM